MNEYNVSDYSIFDNAIATATNANNDVIASGEEVDAVKKIIQDTSVFMGNTAESCVAAFPDAELGFSTLSKNFKAISRHLSTVSAAYQHGDTQASKAVTNVGGTADTNGQVHV